MPETVVGILGTGDMGSAVGAVLRLHGYRVVTVTAGRSQASRALAERAGLEDLGSLDNQGKIDSEVTNWDQRQDPL